MATYVFETITDAEAAGFYAPLDSLRVLLPQESGAAFIASVDGTTGRITLTSGTTGRSVIFGERAAGETVSVVDDSVVVLPSPAAEQLSGSSANDGLFGGAGADTLNGGAGNDVLGGGTGRDVLLGGPGSDTFLFHRGDSTTTDEGPDPIGDWTSDDRLVFAGLSVTTSSYLEIGGNAGSYADALALANAAIASGSADVVAVYVGGSDVIVFADTGKDNGVADDAVVLIGRYLGDIGPANVLAAPAPPPPSPPPSQGTSRVAVFGNMDAAHLSDLLPAVLSQADATTIRINGKGGVLSLTVTGTGFNYENDQLVGGTATGFNFTDAPGDGSAVVLRLISSGLSVNANQLTGWLANDATQTAFATIFGGPDVMGGGAGADLIRGYQGDDLIYGLAGGDTIWGGAGNDVIFLGMPRGLVDPPPSDGRGLGAPLPSYLRGEDGNDSIVGGDGFDDIHGNMGNDTGVGGLGDDWVVGGKDNDVLFGDAGADIVYGNIGTDTCDGGEGADTIRGGQDNDTLVGGSGNDWLSGDRGDDTILGGAGADLFHTFADAGLDRVVDFTVADGDRVLLDPGTQHSVAQVGADTVVTMVGGGQMVLVGVQLSSLPAGWIFVG